MLVYPDTKIYIFCPGNYNGEIADSCHRLGSQLIKFGIETCMIYTPNEEFDPRHPVHSEYKKFNIPYQDAIEDDPKNILLVPEILTSYLYFTNRVRRIIWWLTVENFFTNIAMTVTEHFESILTDSMPRFFNFNRSDDNIEHWVQSEYARQFLKLNGVKGEQIYSVGNYVDRQFLDNVGNVDLRAKRNIVVYRPTKDLDFTEVVRQVGVDIEWRPINNVNPDAIRKLFNEAKVYFDFGRHVSKDLFTREAALCDCVVITGKRGAAGNDIDINIPAEFKFDEDIDVVGDIIKKLRQIFGNFAEEHAKQKDFRDKILLEKDRFVADVALTLGIKPKTDKITVAIVHGLSDMGTAIAELMFEQDIGLSPRYIVDDAARSLKEVIREKEHAYLNLSNGKRLEIISGEVAKFLYEEGRIDKFVQFSNAEAEVNFISEVLSPNPDDVINTAFEE